MIFYVCLATPEQRSWRRQRRILFRAGQGALTLVRSPSSTSEATDQNAMITRADGFLRGVRDTYALTFHMTWQYEKKTRKRAYVSRDFLRDTYAFQGPFGAKTTNNVPDGKYMVLAYMLYRLCQTTRH